MVQQINLFEKLQLINIFYSHSIHIPDFSFPKLFFLKKKLDFISKRQSGEYN